MRERYQVSAPLDGTVERITVEAGDAVAAGAVVATLRPARSALFDPAGRAQAQARLRAAESELASAAAAVASARSEEDRSRAALRRGTALAARQLVARSELDLLRAQAMAAVAALRSARARERALAASRDGHRAALALEGTDAGPLRLPLRSPVAGRVVRRFIESETPVRAGQALVEVGDPGALEVVADVLTADAVQLRPGSPVRLLRWGGPMPLRGHVRTIEPGGFTKVSALGVEEQRVAVVIDFVDPPARRASLGDGFRVDAEFEAWRAPDVLRVPTAALFRDDGHWAAYVVEDGRARLARLELGRIGEDAAELRAGLPEGARVVLYPGDAVRPGRRVAGRDAGP
jgi:HlyD family secretion protein